MLTGDDEEDNEDPDDGEEDDEESQESMREALDEVDENIGEALGSLDTAVLYADGPAKGAIKEAESLLTEARELIGPFTDD